MPEPIDCLSRFTPDGTGLDRDGLLFAAGRASARPNRCWAVLAGTLAASQLLTLVLLWPRPTVPNDPLAEASRVLEANEPPANPPVSLAAREAEEETRSAQAWLLRRELLESKDGELPPAASAGPMVPNDPPWRAFVAALPAGLE